MCDPGVIKLLILPSDLVFLLRQLLVSSPSEVGSYTRAENQVGKKSSSCFVVYILMTNKRVFHFNLSSSLH